MTCPPMFPPLLLFTNKTSLALKSDLVAMVAPTHVLQLTGKSRLIFQLYTSLPLQVKLLKCKRWTTLHPSF